jgi:hypothetical protein
MAGRTALTEEALARLGAAELARLLVELAGKDAVLRRRLRLMLVGRERPERLSAEISARIHKIGRARSGIDRDRHKAVAAELDDLRRQIVDRLGETQPGEAVERLWQLLEIAPSVLERCFYSEAAIEAAFVAAVSDLGRIAASLPGRDPVATADRVAAALDRHKKRGPIFERLIEDMSEALGSAGRAALRARSEADLARLPPPGGDTNWEDSARRFELVERLTILADLERDTDAFVAAVTAGGTRDVQAAGVAERLLAAGRAAEALAFLDGLQTRIDREAIADLRIAAHAALGQDDAAQDLRWRRFEASLSERNLRDFLRLLPDFEGFEAEQRALDLAFAYPSAEQALAFLVTWPDLARAGRLVRERGGELDDAGSAFLRRTAQALDGRFPSAAARLYRKIVENVLRHGAAGEYADAAVDLVSAAGAAQRAAGDEGLEPQAQFIERLRRQHPRKYRFWERVEQTF